MSRTIHVHLSVEGAIRNLRASRGRMAPGFCDPKTGQTLTKREAIALLQAELDAGHPYLPLTDPPCEGWSYTDGCPGHEPEPTP